MSSSLAIIVFAVAIVAALCIHELGHLLVARRLGIRADRYFIGFGPTLWSIRRGEVEYGLKALPLGGFVSVRGMTPIEERRGPLATEIFDTRALGEDRRAAAERAGGAPEDALGQPNLPEPTWQRLTAALDERGVPAKLRDRLIPRTRAQPPDPPIAADARAALDEAIDAEVEDRGGAGGLHHRLVRGDEDRFYLDRPAWQRILVTASGPATHFVLATVVLLATFLIAPLGIAPQVDEVLPDSPAETAGLEPGDRIIAVGDTASDDFEVLRDEIQSLAGQPTELTIERDGETRTLTVTPEAVEDPLTGEQVGQVGFTPTPTRLPAGEAVTEVFVGDTGLFTLVGQSVQGMIDIFSPSGLGELFSQATGEDERGAEGAVSIVGAASIAGQFAGGGGVTAALVNLALLFAVVNVFLGLFNLVPLPPFDGGHIAVAVTESSVNGVRRALGRPGDFRVDQRAIAAVMVPVLVVIAFLGISLLWLDVTDPIQLPG